ncbi:hypothetical protein FBUS_04723 [Fasciolopsis buskii]|uniref:Uncharacterized protein n=1 Tax=Fasciolopsis buskii TaxID=27845 RepID=A0A8E0RME7_9TREM|nr:hypothetical protein FBUS_04723 [Fasciolopsis buski]
MSVIVFILLFTWAEAHSPMQRFGRVKCDYVANVTQYETECFFLGSLTEVPFYRIVSQSVRWLKQHDPKMALISEEKCCFHTHIHMSWNMAEDLLSPIAAVFQDSRGQVFGSELVLSYTQMKKLFAPGVITQVLDFLIGCYCSTLGKRPWATENLTYVTYARAARTAEIEVALVAETARRFLVTAKVNSLHLTWSRNLQTKKALESLNYELIQCGVGETSTNPCHWGRLNMTEDLAATQCVYGLRKE